MMAHRMPKVMCRKTFNYTTKSDPVQDTSARLKVTVRVPRTVNAAAPSGSKAMYE